VPQEVLFIEDMSSAELDIVLAEVARQSAKLGIVLQVRPHTWLSAGTCTAWLIMMDRYCAIGSQHPLYSRRLMSASPPMTTMT
jgi:hypothetical protein